MRSSSAPSVTPVTLSGRASAFEKSNTPANAPEPTIAGEKREPSSLVQATILDRRLGLVADIVERAHDLERRHDAIGAVELATGRLGVEMAAGHDQGQARVAAGPAREDVADPVDPHATPGLLTPADEEPAR